MSNFVTLVSSWFLYASGLRLPVRIIGATLFVLTLFFVVFFLMRGIWLRFKLWRLAGRLRRSKSTTTVDFSKIFSLDRTLAHLWREYRHTLHEQRNTNPQTGSQELVALRATVSAETFFNPQTLVDNRLRTEFFKHLPGVCTGLGIIGTFLGLLQGLSTFRVSDVAQEVRVSLDALLHGVSEAFLVSAAAITIAMAITLIEKWLISSLYRATAVIAQRLDGMFEAGAGAEYLERLVKASEESASQTRILKDALIADLKEILSDLAEQQIRATSATNAQLGQQIVAGLQSGLKDPLTKIAEAVGQVGEDQGQAVTKLLTDVLAGFSQRLQDLFGGQMTGIHQLQRQVIDALQAATARMDQMTAGMDAAGQRATAAMAGKMGEAIEAMETRQRVMSDQMATLVERMQGSTTDTIDKMQTGAGTIHAAAADFAKVAQNMTALLAGAGTTTEALTQSARSMTEATQALERIVSDYRGSRDVIDRMLTELRASVENAKKEASLTSDVLTRIDAAASKLSQAQLQAEEYLDKLGETLADAHQEFADNMKKTLGEANSQFYEQITRATQLLRAAIEELEATLSTVE
jgi:hypothetical protein